MFVVLALLLGPYVRPWMEQQSQLAASRSQVERLQREVDALRVERRRWDDPAYVKAQARERLHFVMPGETGYVILDDAPPRTAPTDPRAASAAVPNSGGAARPWYDTVVDSVRQAGAAPVPTGGTTAVPSPAASAPSPRTSFSVSPAPSPRGTRTSR